MNNNIKVLISEEELNKRIKIIGKQITEDYKNEEVILMCILKGSCYFTMDLSRYIKNENLVLDFMKVHSYGINARETTGEVSVDLEPTENLEGKNVIIVEDIIDSGITLNCLYNYLKLKNPKTLKTCVLLDKEERRIQPIKVDYFGFKVEDKFIIGYGLDYDEKLRDLPFIGYLE